MEHLLLGGTGSCEPSLLAAAARATSRARDRTPRTRGISIRVRSPPSAEYRDARGSSHRSSVASSDGLSPSFRMGRLARGTPEDLGPGASRSEEHTSELQSRQYLVC